MARSFNLKEISEWLEAQIAATQIDWMDHSLSGNDELRRQQEVVLDGIYAFREFFLEVPSPAPGQGYEPPDAVWDAVIRQRRVDAIDAQISELIAQREAVTGPEPRTRSGAANLIGQSGLAAG